VVVGVIAKSVIVIIPAASATKFRERESGNLLRNNPFIMEMPFPVPVSFLLRGTQLDSVSQISCQSWSAFRH
jgi:hypothetical protein